MKKILTLGISLIVVFVFLGLMPVHGEADVYKNVMRLHVVANSNTEADQMLKLEVRDEVLEVVSDICSKNKCESIESACLVISENIEEIEKSAEQRIAAEGYDYDVKVLLGEENYPTKNYEDLAFPAGRYISLQVRIGEAEGEN